MVKSDDGKPLYYEGSVIDTTSLLEAETEKKAFEIIPKENPNPVIWIDYELIVLYANQPGEKLLKNIGSAGFIGDKYLAESLTNVINKNLRNKEIEFETNGKHYLLYI